MGRPKCSSGPLAVLSTVSNNSNKVYQAFQRSPSRTRKSRGQAKLNARVLRKSPRPLPRRCDAFSLSETFTEDTRSPLRSKTRKQTRGFDDKTVFNGFRSNPHGAVERQSSSSMSTNHKPRINPRFSSVDVGDAECPVPRFDGHR